ncbi:MAG: hypothetical protein FWE22_07125 [Firmicutes bacterium]|nr:hypothetical protein [Bacillota bacterium]
MNEKQKTKNKKITKGQINGSIDLSVPPFTTNDGKKSQQSVTADLFPRDNNESISKLEIENNEQGMKKDDCIKGNGTFTASKNEINQICQVGDGVDNIKEDDKTSNLQPSTSNKKRKEKKEKFVDDGRVIADMSLKGTKHYDNRYSERPKKKERISITRGERWAMFKAAMLVFGPWLLIFLASIGVVILLLWLWWGR